MDEAQRRLERAAAAGDIDAERTLERKRLQVEHKADCSILKYWDQHLEDIDLFNHAVAKYIAKWPNYCEDCSGWGGIWLLMIETQVFKTLIPAQPAYYDQFTCSSCGWDEEKNQAGMP